MPDSDTYDAETTNPGGTFTQVVVGSSQAIDALDPETIQKWVLDIPF
ncbi:MAG TPA: hypothetical protein VFV38_48590 [Ktedonobacteraceae bacterium]|nr:hypothetical protein [Ktedonobacteraceae bacterium]